MILKNKNEGKQKQNLHEYIRVVFSTFFVHKWAWIVNLVHIFSQIYYAQVNVCVMHNMCTNIWAYIIYINK